MALIVGTDSYISEADAASYITLMGLAELSAPEVLLRRAAVAIDRLYSGRFIGRKRISSQSLAWPRFVDTGLTKSSDFIYQGDAVLITPSIVGTDAFGEIRDFTQIPTELGQAQVELALMLDAGVDVFVQADPQVLKESVTVDVISQSREFAVAHSTKHLHKISAILLPLLAPHTSVRLVRG